MVEVDLLSLVLELGSNSSLCYIVKLRLGSGSVAGHMEGWNRVGISVLCNWTHPCEGLGHTSFHSCDKSLVWLEEKADVLEGKLNLAL